MATADDQIRVSERVKELLDRRRRKGESYNDVLERLLEERNGDFYDGFGILDPEQAEWIQAHRAEAKEKRQKRIQRFDRE